MSTTGSQTDLMRYDLRIQEALRGAVKKILSDTARGGLPGDHHFYVSFRTHARGVQMSDRLRKQYPDEMTIVMQHQFWDLSVGDREFTIGLSFKQIPEKLVIPFDAVTSFVDPSVQFALKFDVESAQQSEPAAVAAEAEESEEKARAPRRLTPKPAAPANAEQKPAAPAETPAAKAGDGEPADNAGKIVSIDAFRKKT